MRKYYDPSQVNSGEKSWGYVNVVDTLAVNFDMPVMVVNGKEEGPTFTVTGGLYPTEYCGVEAAARIYQKVDPEKLSGKLVIIPVVNMPIFQFRTPMFSLTQSLSPMDGKNITNVFPGDLNGSVTEVLAYRLFHDYILPSDYHVDLRGGELTESHLQHTIYLQGVGEIDKTLEAMGVVFGLRYCLPSRTDISHTKPGTLVFEAIKNGVLSIISESGIGYNTQPSDEEVYGHVNGVMNLLIYFNMLDDEYIKPVEQEYLKADRIRVLADAAGVFKHVYDQGEFMKEGDVIGTICDIDGSVLSTLYAQCDSVVHEMMPRRVVYPGDRLYSLAEVTGTTEFSKYIIDSL